jgi:EAL domain-containing protein (putative c-di-GMP-specific phosphodiesterase class I)
VGCAASQPYYLARIRARVMKIDPWLIETMPSDEQSFTTVQRIVGFARALGKRTVAEGVDSRVWLPVLRSAGVDFAQGRLGQNSSKSVDPSRDFST